MGGISGCKGKGEGEDLFISGACVRRGERCEGGKEVKDSG